MSISKAETKPSRVHVIDERCKGCAFCVEFCPQHALYQSDESNVKGYYVVRMGDPEKCTGCELCSMVCPEFAIYVEPEEKEAKEGKD